MTCTDKHKLFIIGRVEKPHSFKNVKLLAEEYTSDIKAWMTSYLFNPFMKNFDKEITKQKGKVFLIIDNCMSHNQISPLQTVKIEFLPPNLKISAFESKNNKKFQSFLQNGLPIITFLYLYILRYIEAIKQRLRLRLLTFNVNLMDLF